MIDRASRRSGKSLIEMILVIAGMSVVLTTAGQLLHRVSRAERSLRNSAAVARAEVRLARDFREDVRAATSAEPFAGDQGDGLRLVSPEATVDYVAGQDSVIRTTTADPARREGYRLGVVAVQFSIENERLAVLNIEPERNTKRSRASSGRLQITAAVGVDRSSTDEDAGKSARPPVEAARPDQEDAP